MPTDALFEKLRLAERRLTAAEERVSFCRAAATKASAVLGGEFVSRSRDVTVHENAVIRLMEAEQEILAGNTEQAKTVLESLFKTPIMAYAAEKRDRLYQLLE